MAPDLADTGSFKAALPLDELSALYHQKQPMAIVPAGDPMTVTTVGSQTLLNLQKTNAYRVGVAQQPALTLAGADTVLYCQALGTVGPARFNSWQQFLVNGDSLDPTTSTNLVGFIVNRFITSWSPDGGLNCSGLLNMPSPVTAIINNQGLTTGGTYQLLNLIPPSAFEVGGAFYNGSLPSSTANSTNSTATPAASPLSTLAIGFITAFAALLVLNIVALMVFVVRYWLPKSGRPSNKGSAPEIPTKHRQWAAGDREF